MINRSVYFNESMSIDSVLEIRLCKNTWEKIVEVAVVSGKSYSWVVRYSLFRLIKRKNLQGYLNCWENRSISNKFHMLSGVAREKKEMSKEQHRHKLCLYGNDELFIRLAAGCLNVTMTHLIRIALEKYLDTMVASISKNLGEKALQSRWAFMFWLGIKIQYDVEFPNISPENFHFDFTRYDKSDYFGKKNPHSEAT